MGRKLVSFFAFLVLIFSLTGCTTYNDSGEIGNVRFAYSKIKGNCYVSNIKLKKDDSRDIILPDTYAGYKVNELGGYYGTGAPDGFGIDLIGDGWFTEEASQYNIFGTDESYLYTDFFDYAEVIVSDVKVTITLPKYLERVKNMWCDSIICTEVTNADSSITVYVLRPVYYFIISDENQYFYTKNGHLFDKATGVEVDGIIYNAYKANESNNF